jgi:predicted HNH restriction endonuclease
MPIRLGKTCRYGRHPNTPENRIKEGGGTRCRLCRIDADKRRLPKKRQRRTSSTKAITYARQYYADNRKHIQEQQRERQNQTREKVLQILGGRCSSSYCRWVNEDGTFGCSNLEMLHIDHVFGGGNVERKQGYTAMIRKILNLGTEAKKQYQLLCANCNWWKRQHYHEFKSWNLGDNRGKSSHLDTRWASKNGINRRVPLRELKSHIADGWQAGRASVKAGI